MPETDPRKLRFVCLVEIEAGLERQALERGADGLAADLQRVAGQAQVPDGAGA